jgi:demethylmenaquinone methyltransferase / 2-methoxy-6-polyprenyl-1,4-benzoquinol methylase
MWFSFIALMMILDSLERESDNTCMLTEEVLLGSKQKTWMMFDKVASTYDFLNKLLSFGIDRYWRSFLSKQIKKNQFTLLDLGTGTGDVLFSVCDNHDVDNAIGMDLSEKMMAVAERKSEKRGLVKKVEFKVGDATAIPLGDASRDVVTMAFAIRNVSDPTKCLADIYRVLSGNGKALILEFSLPKNIIMKAVYLLYFRRVLPFVGGLISGDKHAYSYLNQSVESFPYGSEFSEMMKNVGFKSVTFTPLTFGIATLYVGQK